MILKQEEAISDTRRLLAENRINLEAIREADERLQGLHYASSKRAHVLGRVSLFLETLPQTEKGSEFRKIEAKLRGEISELEDGISYDEIREQTDSILSVIGRRITEWWDWLKLEHRGNPFRLDARKLQIVADSDDGPIPMNKMGAAANWLGCHLVAHLALHTWFTQKGRPVPRFLFLDQPSQVYFPSERGAGGSLSVLEDDERSAVLQIFELIRNAVEELDGGFQVIVTDHADSTEVWFEAAVVERWRQGAALIPSEWLTGDNSTHGSETPE